MNNMPKPKVLIILAAGNASRMKQALEASNTDPSLIKQANTMPKGMIGLGRNGRPFLDYQLYNAAKAGFEQVLLVLNPADTVTKPYYDLKLAQNQVFGLTILYAYQYLAAGKTKPLGTADALKQALEQNPQLKHHQVVVCNADNLYSVNVFSLLYQNHHPAALPSYDAHKMDFSYDKIMNCAILFVNKEQFLEYLIEKPTATQVTDCEAHSGMLGISMNIFGIDYQLALHYMATQAINPTRGEKELPEAISRLASQNKNTVKVYPVAEITPDLTSKQDLLAVKAYLEANFPEL
jgi:glucose-1-phosphate adenylyltransferase